MATMNAPVDATELTAIDDVLRRQWLRLRRWLDGLDAATLRRLGRQAPSTRSRYWLVNTRRGSSRSRSPTNSSNLG